MPRFSEGQRVRVPVDTPTAPSPLYGRVGTVTFVGPPQALIIEGQPIEPLEQQYLVRFDGDGHGEEALESWLMGRGLNRNCAASSDLTPSP